MNECYRRATLVLAPFVSTTGSGSLAEAFSQGSAILASDLLLNRELNERVPGCLETFRSEDSADCAKTIDRLLGDPVLLSQLRERSQAYQQRYSLPAIADAHFALYHRLLGLG